MNPVGRNQPCPCGSGRPFGDCCGREGPPSGIPPRDSALTKLLAFAFHPAFDSDHSIAEVLFWGNLIREGTTPELRWLLASEDATIKYNSWFLFDWEGDNGGTVAELFLQEEYAQLSPAERQFLWRLVDAQLRLYEVECVERGLGVHLLDLWTGERSFVIEREATDRIVTWDLLGARVASDGIGGKVFEGGLYIYPADVKDDIIRHFRRLHRRHHRKFPLDDLGAFYREHGAVFHHLWLKLVAFPEPPQLVTAEGDPFVFCRSVFETDQPDAIRAELSARPEVRVMQDGLLSWREPGDGRERELGSWGIEGNRVVLETTSQERASRGRTWLESLFGDRVRYRATALETFEQTMNELRSRAPRRSPLAIRDVPDESTSAVRELFDRHYHSWIDRPVPALGNRSPRAAARTTLWRSKLVDLLKQLENATERAARSGRPGYDFSWIWRELGLSRPGSQWHPVS
jgi:hypothetical protein